MDNKKDYTGILLERLERVRAAANEMDDREKAYLAGRLDAMNDLERTYAAKREAAAHE